MIQNINQIFVLAYEIVFSLSKFSSKNVYFNIRKIIKGYWFNNHSDKVKFGAEFLFDLFPFEYI